MRDLFIALALIPLVYLPLRRPPVSGLARTVTICLYMGFGGTLTARAIGFSFAQAATIVLGLLLLADTAFSRRRLNSLNVVDLLQFLLVVLLVLHLLLVPQSPISVVRALAILVILLTMKGLPRFGVDAQNRMLDAVVLGGAVVALACVIQYFYSPTLFGLIELPPSYALGLIKRVTGLYGNPNAAAFYLCLSLVTLMVRIRTLRGLKRVAGIFCVGLIGLAALMTQSRAGFLVLVLAICAEVARALRRHRVGGSMALLAVGATAVVLYTQTAAIFARLFPDRQLERLTTDTSRGGRYNQAFDILKRSPFVGDANATFANQRANYHNDVVQILADHGVLIGLLFALVLVMVVVRLRRYARATGEPMAVAGMYVALAGIMVSLTHDIIGSGVLFWVLMGVALAQADRAEAEAKDAPGPPAAVPERRPLAAVR
ncbi:MAG: hypothetical protein QOE45_1093 [Frankiaceae bacterium]|nr:hypothetical protein [Frankiaceae bacterium]